MSSLMRGVLLVNLGTPEGTPGVGPSAAQVRTYLRQFLMDPYVVDIPALFRWLLVNVIILPRRPQVSAAAYRKIWTERGSPLLMHHLELTNVVRQELGTDWKVEPAMRYGNPSIEEGLSRLHRAGARGISVIPLYPQYSLAATQSSIAECERAALAIAPSTLKLRFYPAFYDAEPFIHAFETTIRESLEGYPWDHLLFSFHGLPERQIRRTDATGSHCLAAAACCEQVPAKNPHCYRAQSYATARLLASRLGLSADRYTVSFQSRLGRTPWIRPYTDVMYQELAARGVKRIAVACPAFVADCLETLEEIAIRGREAFRELGGEDVRLIPSLNARLDWGRGLSQMIRHF